MRSNQSAPPKAESPLPATKISPTPAVKVEAPPKSPQPPVKPGSSYPAIHSSTIDLDAKPIHEPSGKSIMDVDMDAGRTFRRYENLIVR
jgi:pre-mRNA 3'-end-processing factor FIP1